MNHLKKILIPILLLCSSLSPLFAQEPLVIETKTEEIVIETKTEEKKEPQKAYWIHNWRDMEKIVDSFDDEDELPLLYVEKDLMEKIIEKVDPQLPKTIAGQAKDIVKNVLKNAVVFAVIGAFTFPFVSNKFVNGIEHKFGVEIPEGPTRIGFGAAGGFAIGAAYYPISKVLIKYINVLTYGFVDYPTAVGKIFWQLPSAAWTKIRIHMKNKKKAKELKSKETK